MGRFGLFAPLSSVNLFSSSSLPLPSSPAPPRSRKRRNEFRIFFPDGTILSWSKVDARGSCYKLRYANLISASVELHRSSPTSSSSRPDLIGTVSRARASMEITSLDAIRTLSNATSSTGVQIAYTNFSDIPLDCRVRESIFRRVLTFSFFLSFHDLYSLIERV